MPDLTPGDEFLNALAGLPHGRTPFQEMEVSAHVVDAVFDEPRGVISTLLPADEYAEFTVRTNQCALYHNALWKAGRIYRETSDDKTNCVIRENSLYRKDEKFCCVAHMNII